jgi:hypothetical protein
MDSELNVLGVTRMFAKYVIHLSKRKKLNKYISLIIRCPNNKRLVFGFKEF